MLIGSDVLVYENKSERKKIWVYAVILFTSAFIVLIITAFSQIKLNKNISEYKSQLSNELKGKSDSQVNLNSVLKLNKRLVGENKSVNEELNKLKSSLQDTVRKISEIENKSNNTVKSYEYLLKANEAYVNGNVIECAVILKKYCNSSLLSKEAIGKYKQLHGKSIRKASYILYSQGYKYYLKGRYSDSAKNFSLSFDLDSYEYFSDDCCFFLANSYLKQGKYALCNEKLKLILSKYPESTYIKEVKSLLKEVENKFKNM